MQGHVGSCRVLPGPASQAPGGHRSVGERDALPVWAAPSAPPCVSLGPSSTPAPHPRPCGPLLACRLEHSLLALGTLEGRMDSSVCSGQSSGGVATALPTAGPRASSVLTELLC